MKSKIIVGLLSVFMGMSLTSCGRLGCTQPDSVNYDPAAKDDDGTCVYPSEVFAGYYTHTDTLTRRYTAFPDSVEMNFLPADSFYIAVDNSKTVYLHDYATCSDSIFCDVTATDLTQKSDYDCSGKWKDLTGKLTDKTLRYTYKIEKNNGITEEVKGTAVKYE